MPLVVLYAAVYCASAFTVTGVAKVTVCHPEVDSLVKVAVASCVPAALIASFRSSSSGSTVLPVQHRRSERPTTNLS